MSPPTLRKGRVTGGGGGEGLVTRTGEGCGRAREGDKYRMKMGNLGNCWRMGKECVGWGKVGKAGKDEEW